MCVRARTLCSARWRRTLGADGEAPRRPEVLLPGRALSGNSHPATAAARRRCPTAGPPAYFEAPLKIGAGRQQRRRSAGVPCRRRRRAPGWPTAPAPVLAYPARRRTSPPRCHTGGLPSEASFFSSPIKAIASVPQLIVRYSAATIRSRRQGTSSVSLRKSAHCHNAGSNKRHGA